MSTIKCDTLQNVAGTESVPVATVANGTAKAWVNFNGTGTVAIRASFNVSSITDAGVGAYTVNFTTAMSGVNYAVFGTGGDATNSYCEVHVSSSVAPTTTSVRVNTVAQSGGAPALWDWSRVSVAIFD